LEKGIIDINTFSEYHYYYFYCFALISEFHPAAGVRP